MIICNSKTKNRENRADTNTKLPFIYNITSNKILNNATRPSIKAIPKS